MNRNEIELLIKANTEKAQSEIKALKEALKKLEQDTKNNAISNKGLADSYSKVSESANKLKSTLLGLVSAYAGLEGIKSITEYSSKLEQGFIDISKTTGATGKDLDDLKDKIYDLTKELSGSTIFDLQNIVAGAGQLGVAKKDIIDFTKTISKISVALDLTADEASSDMAVLANVFKIPIVDVERLGSSINELSSNTTADVNFILDSTKRMAGVGASFGLTADQITAVSATLHDIGVSSELGSTAFSQFLLKMQTDTEKFAKVAGVSLTKFANEMKTKPIEAITLFLNGLNNLKNKSEALKSLGLNGSGLVQTMLGLSGSVDKLNKALNISKKAYKDNVSIANEYANASNSIKAKQADITNALARLSKELIVELTPAIKSALISIREFIDGLDPKEIANFGKALIDNTTAFATFIADNKTLIKSIGETIIAFKALSIAGNTLAKVGGFKDFLSMAKGLGVFNKDISTSTRLLASLNGKYKGLIGRFKSFLNLSKAFVATPLGATLTALAVAVTAVSYAINKADEDLANYKKNLNESIGVLEDTNKTLKDFYGSLNENGLPTFSSTDEQKAKLNELYQAYKKVSEEKTRLNNINIDNKYDVQISSLSKSMKYLQEAMLKVKRVKKEDIEATRKQIEANKRLEQSQMALTKEHRKYINDLVASNNKRLQSNQDILSQLEAQEKAYINKVARLQEELGAIRNKYANRAYNIKDDTQTDYNTFIEKGLTEYERYEAKKTDIARRAEQVREALKNGDTSQANLYIDKYKQDVEAYVNYEINNLQKVGKTRREVEDEYYKLLKQNEDFKLAALQIEEQAEIKAHLYKLQNAQIELEATKAQIIAQQKLLQLLSQISNKSAGVKIEADYTEFTQSINDINAQINALEQQKKQIKIGVKFDKANLEKAKLNDIKGGVVSKKLKIDITQAKNELNNISKSTSKPITKKLQIDSKDIQKQIKALTKLNTSSVHTIKIDASKALSVIDNLKKPTSSTHTIYIKQVKQFSTGGAITNEDDNYIPREGRLNGYGGGDRIKALLEAGEFIINKKAVSYYGDNLIHMINDIALPKELLRGALNSSISNIQSKTFNTQSIQRLSTGGAIVNNISTGREVIPESNYNTPIHINLGDMSVKTLGTEEVATLLKEYFENYGGI